MPPFPTLRRARSARPYRGFKRPSLRRVLVGGSAADTSRLPRYIWIAALGFATIWAPITGYLKTAAPRYASHMSLILPGSGASASVNLAEIGQASSFANSAFASNSISPTETYKRLLAADRVVRDAARRIGLEARAFGKPQVELVDQTAFIHIKMTGPSPESAQARNGALLQAFFAEIDRLRQDELSNRHESGLTAIDEYRKSVASTRAQIAQLQGETGLRSVEQFSRQLIELEALRTRLDDLRAMHERKAASVAALERKLGSDAGAAAAILRLNNDATYLGAVDQMSQAAADLATARSSYGARHPEVVKARAEFEAQRSGARARAQALGETGEVFERAIGTGRGTLLTELVRLETERAGYAAERVKLEAQLDQNSARLDRLAPLAARLEDLQRDFNVAEAVFASAIARSQSSKTDIYASYPLVQVLEDPTHPDGPSSPRKKLAIAAGGAGSFLLLVALGMGWLRQSMIRSLLAKGRSA
ncbi:hypothetical protein ERN12_16150 [Rhodobacteraceae bacterium]|nr:hypothetical protein ERN12_16150 [Paracoccaceae bacterium]